MKKGYLTYVLPVFSACMLLSFGTSVMAEGTVQTELAEKCFSLNEPDSILKNHDALQIITTVYDAEDGSEEKITTYLADLGMCITQYDSEGNLIRIDKDERGIHIGGYEVSGNLLYRMVFPDDEKPDEIRNRYYELFDVSDGQRILSTKEEILDSGETETTVILTASGEEALCLAGETFSSGMQDSDCWVEVHTFGNGRFRSSVQYYIAPSGDDAGTPDPDRSAWKLVSESSFSMPDQYGEQGEDFLYKAHDSEREAGMKEGKTLKSLGLDIPKDADTSIRDKIRQINGEDRTLVWHVIDAESGNDTPRMETAGAGVIFVPICENTEITLYQDAACTEKITAETDFVNMDQIAVYSRKGSDIDQAAAADAKSDAKSAAAADTVTDPSEFMIVDKTADITNP